MRTNPIRFICALISIPNVLYSHRDDGNIWAIYMDGYHLLIGDFWASSLLVLCVWYVLFKPLKQEDV